jgi:hypothetical protein
MPDKYNLIDTFPNFIKFWKDKLFIDTNSQVDFWESFYKNEDEEIFKKVIKNYSDEGIEWKDIAKKMIFPINSEKIIRMNEAHINLQKVISDLYNDPKAMEIFPTDLTFVIYVGIGTGAGWATDYRSKPAVLFGLENIIDMHWENEIALRGLVIHETGHVLQEIIRRRKKLPYGDGPIWHLYEEGFAEYFESLLLNSEEWHQSLGQPGWSTWCEDHIQYLSTLFLNDVASSNKTNRFFGSWYDIEGWKETGYYLGYRIMKQIELPLRELACLTPEEIETKVSQTLSEFANSR